MAIQEICMKLGSDQAIALTGFTAGFISQVNNNMQYNRNPYFTILAGSSFGVGSMLFSNLISKLLPKPLTILVTVTCVAHITYSIIHPETSAVLPNFDY